MRRRDLIQHPGRHGCGLVRVPFCEPARFDACRPWYYNMGRPVLPSGIASRLLKMKTISLKVPEQLDAKLSRVAKQRDQTKSHVVRAGAGSLADVRVGHF